MVHKYVEMVERRREVVAGKACPRCLAQPGQPCMGKDGKPRKSNHTERLGRKYPRGPREQPTYPVT